MEIKLKSAWDKLSMLEKALLIKLSVDNGVSSLKLIRDTYNLYSEGGQKEVLDKVNSSNANFVQRLKDPNRKNIPDWESPTDRISTHKLSVGTDENGNHYIFPEVQEINGELIDFTRPPYNRFAGEISAEMRGDTVRVPSLEDAIKFTETYKQYYPLNNGGNLAHKKSGEELGESQELNTKTYKEKKESSAYPMHYNVLSLSLGDTSLSGAILRALIHKNAEDPNIYTGSYYFGDKWGFGTSLELPQNRNLISLYLDGDTTGFKQFNGKPIVLDGDTLTQTLYEGTLLPLDTIYLRPESKATIARMAKDRDLLKINNSFPGWMSYSSKYNFLDSPYFLDKYEGKVMDDANNLNISFKQNSDGSYYADVFDLWDLTGTGGYKAGARLEKKLATDSIENNGPFILRLHIPIVFNKDSVSDGRFLDAISVGQWQKEIDDTNQKSTGGPLYPFSFEKNPFLKTPAVRYDEGGFFAKLFGKKDTPPTPEEIKADRVERFINDTWETEYSVPRGYDPITGLYFPYNSPEGGTKTIGPGFKLRADGSGDATMFSAKEAAKGVTREQINEKLRAQGELQYDKVLEFLNQKGNRLPVDTINPNIMNGLMDLRFLVGALGGWDNLREAVLNGDLESIKKESLVTFKDGDTGKIKPDVRRNELRAKKFWHYD